MSSLTVWFGLVNGMETVQLQGCRGWGKCSTDRIDENYIRCEHGAHLLLDNIWLNEDYSRPKAYELSLAIVHCCPRWVICAMSDDLSPRLHFSWRADFFDNAVATRAFIKVMKEELRYQFLFITQATIVIHTILFQFPDVRESRLLEQRKKVHK